MNRASFDALYREHYRRVVAFCRRMLGSDAEDAAQEAFMRAWRGRGKYKPTQPFGAWVGAIAANHCIDLLRKQKRLEVVFKDEPDAVDAAELEQMTGVDVLIAAQSAEAISRAVESLEEKYRLPLILAYHAECGYDEIAASLGVTRNHVGVLLVRAKARLKQALASQHGGEVS